MSGCCMGGSNNEAEKTVCCRGNQRFESMKIALFVDQFPKVSETFILSQIGGLLANGHEIDIFPCSGSDDKMIQEDVGRFRLVDKTHLPRNPSNTLVEKAHNYIWFFRLILFHIKEVQCLRQSYSKYPCIGNWIYALTVAEPLLRHGGKYDVLFAHFGPNGLRASWYRDAGLVQGPLVTVFHGFDLSTYLHLNGEQIYRPLFNSGDLFLPISRFWKNKLQELGCPSEKIKVHHVGINCEQFYYKKRIPKINSPKVLISVARLVEKKGIEYAIRAMARLVIMNVDVRYRIIGSGPLEASLRQLTSELGLANRIEFLGTKTSGEIAEELTQAQLFLAPSTTSGDGDMEGIPTVLMEAMATGLPVISTYHSGIPELVEDGISGKLVPERDVESLAQAIKSLIDDVDHWSVIGKAGRGKVLKEFNAKALNHRLEQLFENVAESGVPFGKQHCKFTE